MRLTFLGTGTSIGVPAIGCSCEVCQSTNPHDKRLRASAIVESDEGLRILIDPGPDFRQQILRQPFSKFDAVLITHIHYDHVGGADDLRPFAWFGDVDVYAQQDVIDGLHQTMPYCFKKELYPGVPHLHLHKIESGRPFHIMRPHEITVKLPPSGATLEGHIHKSWHSVTVPAIKERLEVLPVRVMHGALPILGFRLGRLAYITDMKSMDEENTALLYGVEVLVVNALRFEKEHHSHQLVDDAVRFAHRVGAKRTYLTHLTHDIGTHDIANSRLPQGVEFAYDGLTIECP